MAVRSDLGLTNTTMGVILSTWQFVYIGAAIPCGILLDRLQPRVSLLLAGLLIALSAVMRGLAQTDAMMVVAVGILGLGGPLISVGGPKFCAQWFSGVQRGMAIGINTTSAALGGATALAMTSSVLIPLLGGDWRNVMFLYGALALLSGVAAYVIASHTTVQKRNSRHGETAGIRQGGGLKAILSLPSLRIVLVVAAGVLFINQGFNNWLPEILRHKGLSEAEAGYWASMSMIAGIVGSLVMPRFAVRRRRTLILGLMFTTIMITTFVLLAPAGRAMIAALVLLGAARNSATAIAMLLIIELPGLREENHSLAAGIFWVVAVVGGMLGTFAIGALFDASGSFESTLFLIAMMAGILMGLTFYVGRLQQRYCRGQRTRIGGKWLFISAGC